MEKIEKQIKSSDYWREKYRNAFDILLGGNNTDTVQDELGYGNVKLAKAVSTFIALEPERAAELFPKLHLGIKILIDECVSHTTVFELAKVGFWSAHVDHLGLSKMKDRGVVDFAKNNGYSAIITVDASRQDNLSNIFNSDELTDIVVADYLRGVENCPTLFHVGTSLGRGEEVGSFIGGNVDEFFHSMFFPLSPFAEITSEKGIEFQELEIPVGNALEYKCAAV